MTWFLEVVTDWVFSLQEIHPNTVVLPIFLLKKLKKKREDKSLLFWGKRGSIARNVIKGRVEILETDEIMTVFPRGIFFNNR